MGKKSKNKRAAGQLENDFNMVNSISEPNSEAIKSLFTDAESALDSFHYETASECCQQILKLDSDNIDAMDMLGSICSELGSVDEAKSLWLKCVELSPDTGYKKYFGLAQIFVGKESLDFYKKGITLLEKQLEETENAQPDQNSSSENLKLMLSDGYCAVAELYMTDLCDEEDASDVCKMAIDKSISIHPENPDSYRILASFSIIADKLEDAKVAIQKNLDLWYNEYEAMCNNPDDEVEIKVPLPDYLTRIEIGKILIELQMYDQAVKIFEGLLQEDDEIFLVWYLLGILYYSQGEDHFKTAFRYFKKAEEISHKTEENDSDEALHIKELLETFKFDENDLENSDNVEDGEDNLSDNISSSEDEEEMNIS